MYFCIPWLQQVVICLPVSPKQSSKVVSSRQLPLAGYFLYFRSLSVKPNNVSYQKYSNILIWHQQSCPESLSSAFFLILMLALNFRRSSWLRLQIVSMWLADEISSLTSRSYKSECMWFTGLSDIVFVYSLTVTSVTKYLESSLNDCVPHPQFTDSWKSNEGEERALQMESQSSQRCSS